MQYKNNNPNYPHFWCFEGFAAKIMYSSGGGVKKTPFFDPPRNEKSNFASIIVKCFTGKDRR